MNVMSVEPASSMHESSKTFLIIAIFATCLNTSIAALASKALPAYCSDGRHPIVVNVHGLRNNKGSLKAKLYGNDPDEFLVSGKKLDSKRESPQGTSTVICLHAPHFGTYAIVVHHDENGNKKLDRNWIGMPTEGVGFSNNPKLFFAIPNHDDVTFDVGDGITTIDIRLHY